MRRGLVFYLCLFSCIVGATTFADESLYRYEGNVLPYDASAGWTIANPCEDECNELLENGHFVLFWPTPGDNTNYNLEIARSRVPPPPTLWVEWRYRSNHPIGQNFFVCDGEFSVRYDGMNDSIHMYGDLVISSEGGDFISGLDIDEFHTYRFESLDGINYGFYVDGQGIFNSFGSSPTGLSRLQLRGHGGCGLDNIPNQKHEWDYVRYGTISFGEQIIATEPPSGIVSPQEHPNLDRFIVTFDSPNYSYIDDITVQVTGGIAPQVIQTHRRENDEPDTLEIVLDRPLSEDEITTFIFNDGQTTNEVVFAYGCADPTNTVDSDGDGFMDCLDDCPNDPNKTEPGQCGCGNPDVDTDNDGTANCVDGCPDDPNKSTPGQCGCSNSDVDTDSDGTSDCIDGCPDDPNKIGPGQCGCGNMDIDTDEDGTVDCLDGCPVDQNKTDPGQCGCGMIDTDTDNDGTADCVDDCPTDPNKTLPGQCGCGNSDIDTDRDGTSDCIDICPTDPNKIAPGQCGCGQAEGNVDSDGDGVIDCLDQCPGTNDTVDLNENNTPDCIEAIPAVSTWGLVILTLLLLSIAKCAPRLKQASNVRQ